MRGNRPTNLSANLPTSRPHFAQLVFSIRELRRQHVRTVRMTATMAPARSGVKSSEHGGLQSFKSSVMYVVSHRTNPAQLGALSPADSRIFKPYSSTSSRYRGVYQHVAVNSTKIISGCDAGPSTSSSFGCTGWHQSLPRTGLIIGLGLFHRQSIYTRRALLAASAVAPPDPPVSDRGLAGVPIASLCGSCAGTECPA